MTRLLRILAVALLALGLPIAMASPALAYEEISSYEVTATVAPDTTLSITEQIDYDFGTAFKHGIYRDIPIEDELPDGSRWIYQVNVTSVTMDGSPVPWTLEDKSPYISVKVGDPDNTISGGHTYLISYTVAGALKQVTAEDLVTSSTPGVRAGDVELYWDFIGTEWGVGIAKARVEVTGPATPTAADCYTGQSGFTAVCAVLPFGPRTVFGPVTLSSYEGLTVDLAYPATAFTAIPAPTIQGPNPKTNAAGVLPFALPLAGIALVAPILWALITRRRNKGVEIPLAPVRFGPPDNLRPAQIRAGLEGDQDSRSVMATLLDFVARKHITLASEDGGFLAKDRLNLAWWGAGKDDLRPWETALLSVIFQGQPQATLGTYDPAFAAAVSQMGTTLKAEAIAAGRMNPKGWAVRTTVGCIVGPLILLGVVAFFASMFLEDMRIFAGVLPVVVALIIGLVIARFLIPERQTASSAQFEADVQGFKRFLDTDPGAARRDLVQRLGLPDYAVFATMLPYAVLFDLESSWSGAFPDLTPEQMRSSGLFLANAWAINSLVSQGSTSLASSYTAPSRSGGSGFSGGSSGGGGGGGGGGSW